MEESLSKELVHALDRGGLVLTGNDRAARSLRRSWDRLQVGRGKTSWVPGQILTWHSWTQLVWKRLLLDGRVAALLLSPSQERRVWHKVLDADSGDRTSLSETNSLETLASATWHRLSTYKGRSRLSQLLPGLRGDSLQFARWARSFEAFCARESLLSGAVLEEELRHRLETKDLASWNAGVLLLGFDRFTPAQNALIERCRTLGIAFDHVSPALQPSGVLVSAASETEELQGCARYIQGRLADDPPTRIALIVSDLEQQMGRLDSVLREHLSPHSSELTALSDDAPYEFSLGRPLAHEPMVQCAIDLVRWTLGSLPIEQVSRLLLSPYFSSSEEEMLSRAEVDATDLRRQKRLRPEFAISDFATMLRRSSVSKNCLPFLADTVGKMERALKQADPRSRGFGEWSEWIRAWLTRAGWCLSGTTPTSREYQVHQRWEDALDEMAGLDFLGEEVTLDIALAQLERLAQDIIFAPASRDAPIQVMGPLEAAGSHFDLVWVLQAGEFSWPPGTVAVPLLPWSMQRDLGMPGTDAAAERDVAQQMTTRLAMSAKEVVFSYAKSLPNGRSQRAAAVVRHLRLRSADISQVTPTPRSRSLTALERLADTVAVPYRNTDAPRGGARVLELQAACGFRAFSELRLGSAELRERTIGFNPMERGTLVHDTLERFWRSIGSQRELLRLGEGGREAALRQAVVDSLAHVSGPSSDRWEAAYLEAQQTRLFRLLKRWVAIEMERPEFTVTAQETQQSVAIGPLHLSLRVDRVDVVDGRQVIIDYKTGLTSTSEWLGDRPDSPQVPLYAVLAAQTAPHSADTLSPLGAVGFAQIRPGDQMSLRGFQATPGILSLASGGRPATMDAESFEAQVDRWYEILERLATEFADGDTRVRPKRYPTTCERCGQRSLCRVDGSLFANIVETEADDSDE